MKLMKNGKKSFLRRTGFTMVEIMVVIAMIGIFMMLAMPNIRDYVRTGQSISLKEKHKMMVFAISSWGQDNKLNYQRPGDFEVRNSQGRTVVDYLTDDSFTYDASTGRVLLQADDCIITFEKGVMVTTNQLDRTVVNIYTVFEPEDPNASPADMKLKDFEVLRGTNKDPSETAEQYAAKLKNKNIKKLLLEEDNVL